MGGSVDTIVIGGRKDEAPNIAVSFYKNEKSEYLGAAIGSGWNGVTDLKLSCGDIQILSGSVKVEGGNIGYGVLMHLPGNSMEGGSVTISEEVQLELPLESKLLLELGTGFAFLGLGRIFPLSEGMHGCGIRFL